MTARKQSHLFKLTVTVLSIFIDKSTDIINREIALIHILIGKYLLTKPLKINTSDPLMIISIATYLTDMWICYR